MRKSDIDGLTQNVDVEGFSSLGSGRFAGSERPVRPILSGPASVPVAVLPALRRINRSNPISGQEQARQTAAVTSPVGAASSGEAPTVLPRSEPSQVRYWRTPNRLLKEVWATRADTAVPLSPATGFGAHPGEDLQRYEADGVALQREGHGEAAPEDRAIAPKPFALISDFAFWEGLSGAVPDEAGAGPGKDQPDDAVALAPHPVVAAAPLVLTRKPALGRKTMPAPAALWSTAMATPTYSVKLSSRPRNEATGEAGGEAWQRNAPAITAHRGGDSPVSGGGIVVTRKAREAAAQAPSAPPPRPDGRAAETTPVPLKPAEFELPPLTFLGEPPEIEAAIPTEILQQNAGMLEGVLEDFNVRGEIVQACPGPVVTLYELEPAPGTKSSRVISLADDIARSMSAISARVAVIPGKNAIGIELPNAKRETVYLRELLASQDFESSKHKLALGLGKTIGGEPVIVDLAKMPHLLVAGTTGSGKSVAINTMILSLLYRLKPEQCRLIMVDPKMLELSVYDGIPHLLTPVVTDPKKAVVALKWAVREMEERYKKMSKLSVRNIDGFNARVVEAKAAGEVITRTVQTGFDRHSGEAVYEEEVMDLEPLPYIVVIVDEMADLMMVAGKEIEGTIQRLAQMARAAGIHVVLATQRPSVDVITGTIKANFPTRISFQVTSKIDSRTILGEMGAEQLLGQGDMLYMAGGGRITRVHGPFVSDQEVERVVAHLKTQGRPQYLDAVTSEEEAAGEEGEDGAVFDKSAMGQAESDDPYDQAVAVVLRDKKASTSYIQRRLQIGYNRAASIMERMENEGIVGPANHAGKRDILVETGRAREDED
jgi:S-DNA-T family DNA segregation ATPase FtsK/SpoIIIE